MEQITADLPFPPEEADTIAIELMFLAARRAADIGEWEAAQGMLEAAGEVLAAKARRAPDPIGASETAGRYRALVEAVMRRGGEPLRIDLSGDAALVETRDPENLLKEEQRWAFIHGSWARSG